MTTQLPSGRNPAIQRRLGVSSVAYTPQIDYSTQHTAARQLRRPQPPLQTSTPKPNKTNKHQEKEMKSQRDNRRPPSGIRLQKLDSSRPSTPSLSRYTPLPDIPAPESRKSSTATLKRENKTKLLKTNKASVTPEKTVVALSDTSIERLTLSTTEGQPTNAHADDANSSFQTTISIKTGTGKPSKNYQCRKNRKTFHKTSDALPIKQNTDIVSGNDNLNTDIGNGNLYKNEEIKIKKTVEPSINLNGIDHSSQINILVINDNKHSSMEKRSIYASSETRDLVTAQTSNEHSSEDMPSSSPVVNGRDGVSTSIVASTRATPTYKTPDQLTMKTSDTKQTEVSQIAEISRVKETLTSKPKTDTRLQSKKISLALKLPNGKRILKDFKRSETLQAVVDQARSLTQFPDEVNVAMSTSSIPKIVFSNLNVKISESGLKDRTLLHVHVNKAGSNNY